MNFWPTFACTSLGLNAFLAWQWLRYSRSVNGKHSAFTNQSIMAEKIAAEKEIFHLRQALTLAQNDLRMVMASPLVGVFKWGSANENSLSGIANPAFLEMMGYPIPDQENSSGPEGLNPSNTYSLQRSLFGEEEWKSLIEIGHCRPHEVEYTRVDGAKVSLILAAERHLGDSGSGIGLVIDVTFLKNAKRELRHSEERYRALAEGSPMGIWNIRIDGRTLYINPSMANILELENPQELMDSSSGFESFFTSDSLAIMKLEHAKRIRGKGSTYEVEVIGKWGKRTRMMVYGTPVPAHDGQLESLMGTFLDITEKKREEEALRQSEERLRVASECGNDLIYEWDLESGRMDWFGPVEQRLGFANPEIPNARDAFERLVHPEDRSLVTTSIEKHFRSRIPFLQEYRVRGKDGAYRLWSDRGTAIWDASGMPQKWIGSASDITEKRNAENTLRAQQDQLRQAQKLEAVGRLAGGIAHDFNNLLAAIMGYCELMLLRLEPDHTCRREVGEILNGSDRAAGLIRQLLAFGRQEIPQPKVIQPNFILVSMQRILKHLIPENIDLKVEFDPIAPWVRIDPVQLEQVIMNLVLNACDAMPKGGQLKIISSTQQLTQQLPKAYGKVYAGPHVRISVVDSGSGIDEEHLPLIFDPFYTTKNRSTGNGLGLSTVYGIVTQNRGCVIVDTEVSKGTTFSFFLPITDQMPESELEILKVLRSSTVVPKTILLVEDEEEVRSAIRDLLTQKGFMIIEAKNGKQALAVAQDYPSPIHLLLTDMIMPEMGGKELAESLEKIMPNLRVLFMSGYTQDEAFRKDAASGRRCFIQKPFSLSILLAKVNEAMILEGTLA